MRVVFCKCFNTPPVWLFLGPLLRCLASVNVIAHPRGILASVVCLFCVSEVRIGTFLVRFDLDLVVEGFEFVVTKGPRVRPAF